MEILAVTAPTLREFAEAHGRRLVALCLAMTGNEHDAWDLAQGTLERMGKVLAVNAPDDPWAYAVRVASNLNIDRIRRARREVIAPEVAPHAVSVDPPDAFDPWLRKALESLTAGQRTAMALRYLDDFTTAQIAQVMGCSEATVRTHLSRGTQRLRDWAQSNRSSRWKE